MFVAPLITLSTIVLLATGVALLVLNETQGFVVGLHKASFIVWLGAASLHVLAHIASLPRILRRRTPGFSVRIAVAAVAVLAGALLAVATLPAADRLQDRVSGRVGLDTH